MKDAIKNNKRTGRERQEAWVSMDRCSRNLWEASLEQGLKEDQEALRGPSTLEHPLFKRWSLTSLSTGFGSSIQE